MPGEYAEGDQDPPRISPDSAEKVLELKTRIGELEKRKNPPPDTILRYFEFAHLKDPMREMSSKFYEIARDLVHNEDVIDQRERQVALRKLLEAKDCAVRSVIKKD